MSFGPEIISNYDLSSLRVLGSVGEPINPEAWRWYNEHVRLAMAMGGEGRWGMGVDGLDELPGSFGRFRHARMDMEITALEC